MIAAYFPKRFEERDKSATSIPSGLIGSLARWTVAGPQRRGTPHLAGPSQVEVRALSARGLACEFKKFVAARWLLAEAVLGLVAGTLGFLPRRRAPASGSLGQGRTFPRGA